MKQDLRTFWVSLVTLVMLACATCARAAEGAEQSGTTSFKWVHFVIVAILAYWVFAKVLPPFFRRKSDDISSAIAKAAAAKAEAERQLKEAVAKLATLEHEVARFRAQAQQDATAELERLRGMIKVDADKIGLAAKAEIEAAVRAARVELKELAAKLAMDRAESLVSKELTPALQEAMVNNFVQTLQGRPN